MRCFGVNIPGPPFAAPSESSPTGEQRLPTFPVQDQLASAQSPSATVVRRQSDRSIRDRLERRLQTPPTAQSTPAVNEQTLGRTAQVPSAGKSDTVSSAAKQTSKGLKEGFTRDLESAGRTQPNMRLGAITAVFDRYESQLGHLSDRRLQADLMHMSLDSLKLLAENHKGSFPRKPMESALERFSNMLPKLESEHQQPIKEKISLCKSMLRAGREFDPDMRNIRASKRLTSARKFNLKNAPVKPEERTDRTSNLKHNPYV